jgi:lysophospholipase L1-like esterase
MRWILIGLGIVVGLFVITEALLVIFNGSKVPMPTIPRGTRSYGTVGTKLQYVVLGDSTAIAQGADYDEGYAVGTSQHLAQTHQVGVLNLAVSGARAGDVLNDQLPQMIDQKPDVVLIAVGANDVTHLTMTSSVEHSVKATINQLVKQNCDVKIVITGAAQMGAVPRFPQPLRALAGRRSDQLNSMFERLSTQQKITFARVAAQTGPQFKKNPGLFAADKFHPNAAGYALWTNAINTSLDQALASQPSHCSQD